MRESFSRLVVRNSVTLSFAAFCAVSSAADEISAGSPETPNQPAQTNPPAPQTPTNGQTPQSGSATSVGAAPGQTGSTSVIGKIQDAFFSWGGVRPSVADHYGITFVPSLTVDYSKNLMGGANTAGDSTRNLFDFRINLDTANLLNWQGGTFSIDFQNQSGTNGTDDLGDVQGYDNIDADGRTQISELWYEQKLLDEKLRFKFGKVDANTEFAGVEYAQNFLNSSFGYSPAITAMPTYPDGALSVNLFVYPAPWLYAGYGIYDGDSVGNHSPVTAFKHPTDYFQIAEVGLRWSLAKESLPGRLAAGAFYDNAPFETFSGRTQSGTAGGYVVLEQKIVHTDPDAKDDQRGLYAFTQVGFGDAEVNSVRQQIGAGLTWVGPYAKENPDIVGVGVTAALLSDAAGSPFTQDTETTFELFYDWQATSYLSIKPDLQYIVHPGGAGFDDALVATLRVTFAF